MSRSSRTDDLEHILTQGLARMALTIAPEGQAALLAYIRLLAKWNRAYNLTAVRDPAQMVARHLLDSLSVAPYIQGPRVLDVGSGPGLPGIPLAVCYPHWQFVLLDSNAKKTRFMIQAAGELGLGNVTVKQARAEEYQATELFDTVISRAFGEVRALIRVAGRLCRPGGMLIAMKGRHPEDELAAIPDGYTLAAVHPLVVPGVEAPRCAVCLRRLSDA